MRATQILGRWISAAAIAGLLLLITLPARGNSSAPGSCVTSSMYPVHGNAQSGNGGYTVASSSPTYSPGQVISITLNGTQNFKGLLLYVFDSAGTHRGAFQIPVGYQAMNSCPGDPSSTVGHASATIKTTPVSFSWTAPTSTDPLTVVAAVMVNLTTYFVLNPITIDPVASSVDGGGSSTPHVTSSLRVDPNPFTQSATIHYSLEREASISLRIFDLNGRLVRAFDEEAQKTGLHSVEWDGRDGQGTDSGVGVYFVCLNVDGAIEVQKILRLESGQAQK